MPIYEYQCEACGHRLEVLQKISEEPLADCPNCGKPSLQKLISAAGFRLKGSGWYATDFKDSGKDKKQTTEASRGQGTSEGKSADPVDKAKTGDAGNAKTAES
jgi:putative FmdB family regulatory protein